MYVCTRMHVSVAIYAQASVMHKIMSSKCLCAMVQRHRMPVTLLLILKSKIESGAITFSDKLYHRRIAIVVIVMIA